MKKQEARLFGLSARNNLPADLKADYDKIIFSNILSLKGFLDYEDYFVYMSYKSEVSTCELIKYLLSTGKTVFVPKVFGEEMQAVKYSLPLKKNSFGIYEPEKNEFATKISVCVTPLAAADKNLNRVGYGKGYYDKFFEKHDCVKIGLCYSSQVFDEIEKEKNDVALDVLITEKYKIKEENNEIF